MTNFKNNGQTQGAQTENGKWIIPVKNLKEAKKLFSKLNKKQHGLVFSSEGDYIYRTSLPNFCATYKDAAKDYENNVSENCVEILYDFKNHPIFFKEITEYLEAEYSYLNL